MGIGIINYAGNVFFNSISVFLSNKGQALEGGKNKMVYKL
jgi:hypothetical protein